MMVNSFVNAPENRSVIGSDIPISGLIDMH